MPSPTLSGTATPTATLTPRIPVTGAEGPEGFIVGPWHDTIIVCDKFGKQYPVNLVGVDISGGNPPFEIVFEEHHNSQWIEIDRFIITNTGRVDFPRLVPIKRGRYAHVTITFGSSVWEDDLMYPLDYAHCDED